MLPLEGVLVLDLSNYSPGALCTMILADFGAEVVKIEPAQPFPHEGMGYSPKSEEKRRKAAFFALNRNKKSIGINLKSPKGREIFYRLVQNADVVIEGYRPGVVKRLAVDYETIRRISPRIIYCSLSGYGQDGPYSYYSGHDINYISISGVLGLIGPSEGAPSVPANVIADYAGASLYGAIAILLAYIARDKTGEGQYIDHSYMECAIHLMTRFTQNFFLDGKVLKRGDSQVLGSYPYYAVYETKDGKYLSIGCLEPHFWENLYKFLRKKDFIRHSWNPKTEHAKPDDIHNEMFTCMKEIFLTKARDEWFDLLAPENIPVVRVNDLNEVFSDLQVIARNMVIEVEDPKVGIMPKLSKTPGSVWSVAPLHGDHTDEILFKIGIPRGEIDQMRKEGIIG